jgi:hypothetical protein
MTSFLNAGFGVAIVITPHFTRLLFLASSLDSAPGFFEARYSEQKYESKPREYGYCRTKLEIDGGW